jgi:hypothetical protein
MYLCTRKVMRMKEPTVTPYIRILSIPFMLLTNSFPYRGRIEKSLLNVQNVNEAKDLLTLR